MICFLLLQSSRCFFYVVLESAQVYSIYRVAQLQMENHQGTHYSLFCHNVTLVFLFRARLLCQKTAWSLKHQHNHLLKFPLIKYVSRLLKVHMFEFLIIYNTIFNYVDETANFKNYIVLIKATSLLTDFIQIKIFKLNFLDNN